MNCIVLDNFILTDELFPRVTLPWESGMIKFGNTFLRGPFA